jgi:pyrimidine operon attenuation protein/uracil phosphoribosyltransferase
MNPTELDAEALYAQLEAQVLSGLLGAGEVAVVGIYSGGAWLADRLARRLGSTDIGYIDVSFYRDDVAERGLSAEVKPSQIPFEVEGATILLVDDVLYSGRTVRAALDALNDHGRPKSVLLAVLVDRGHRELPIRADFVGKNLPTSSVEHISVKLTETDGVDEVVIES